MMPNVDAIHVMILINGLFLKMFAKSLFKLADTKLTVCVFHASYLFIRQFHVFLCSFTLHWLTNVSLSIGKKE